ncbi:MAG: M20/M25/M40 family metallo-hydrolase [Candidatus Tectomicrobia bacterium]|nr:M20/M25/M40 family metallo-hydrolase [Candidatus Tectomicrobia bacterium]
MDPHQVLKLIDRDELVDLAVSLGEINSFTGHEREAGDFLYEWLKANGFRVFRQEVAPDRRNVIGVLAGSGGGRSLIFNTHMDSKYGSPDDVWTVGELRPEYTSGWMEQDRIFGHGVYNAKGLIAAFLIAAKAIRASGVDLKGDLLLALVVGEIGMAPVDEFQGGRYWGKGAGSRHLVEHGVTADFALIGEPTHNCIIRAQAGAAYFKITVRGASLYTPFIPRPVPAERNPSAIVKMAKVVQALEDWACEYEKAHRFEFDGGAMVPKVSFGAVRGGLPYKIGNTVGVCSLYLDVRVPPPDDPARTREEILARIADCGIEAEVETYLFRRGYVARNAEALVESIERAHRTVFGRETDRPSPPMTSMWQDINVFNEVGIPAVSYGPMVMRSFETGLDKDYVRVEDLLGICKSYASVALDICRRPR